MTPADEKTAVAFFADIIASPADDTVRLIFADWADEHGYPERAEFIRVQIELERRVFLSLRVMALQVRERELLANGNDYAWAFPRGLLHEPAKWEFCRGFVSAITCGAGNWFAHAAALTACQPIERVRLTDDPLLALRNASLRQRFAEMLGDEYLSQTSRENPPNVPLALAFLWPRIAFAFPAPL